MPNGRVCSPLDAMWISIFVISLEIMSALANANSSALYLGCYKDIYSHRTLNRFYNIKMNPNGALYCRQLCFRKGFRYAGTEFSNECYCGNVFQREEKGTRCNHKCKGNKLEFCGGADRLSVYYTKFCDTKPCQNNGTCTDINVERYQCNCTDSWNGTNCEQVISTSAFTSTTYSSEPSTTDSPTSTIQNVTENISKSSAGINTRDLLVIICGAVGGAVVLCGLLFITCVCYRRRKSTKTCTQSNTLGDQETHIQDAPVTYENVNSEQISIAHLNNRIENADNQTYELDGGTQNEYIYLRASCYHDQMYEAFTGQDSADLYENVNH